MIDCHKLQPASRSPLTRSEDTAMQPAADEIAGRPPNDLPIYRLLTGPDDASFCQRVSEMLELGYALQGSPALTFDGARVIAAQAVIWKGRVTG